ncbi:uncharacterized protein LOC120332262 [Styela clava]
MNILTDIYFIYKHLVVSSNIFRRKDGIRQNCFLHLSHLWLVREAKIARWNLRFQDREWETCPSWRLPDIVRLIKKSRDEKKKAEIKCDVKYDSKCFRIVVYGTMNVTFNDSESICKSMNIGKPANIYNLTHYQMLLTHVRPLIPAFWAWMHIWTGMKYKISCISHTSKQRFIRLRHQNNQLLLSSGENTTLVTEMWYDGYPRYLASWTNVGVLVSKDSEEKKYQGMYNEPPTFTNYGVFCEI